MAEKHFLSETPELGFMNKKARVSCAMSGYYLPNPQQGAALRSDPHFTEPSAVVHVRGVADEAREQDLIEILAPFGKISCVTMMPKLRQALVEFEDINCASNLVQYCQNGSSLLLCGRPAFFNFSKSKNISRNIEVQHESPTNRILLITVINPQYAITTDILHTIFSKKGNVLRIVIFRKSGLQAMVEFDTVEAATYAKMELNGADIYTGCNTLKIEYSKATSLNVWKNDSETYDYTQPKGPGLIPTAPTPKPPVVKQGLLSPPVNAVRGRGGMLVHAPVIPQYNQQAPVQGGCVVMTYGLHADKMNCDKLFNILCCYGNVLKIKFLLNKVGTAMAEMSDHVACNTIIQSLTGTELFGQKIEFGYSKQSFLVDPSTIPVLPDGSPSFVSFTNSKNQRFWSPEASKKNRVFSPTKVLHFYNAPPDITADQLKEMCTEKEVDPPIHVKVFPSSNPSAKTSSGLLEWGSVEKSLEALAACNHYVVRNPGARTIFTIKLAFSSMSTAS